MGITGLDHVNIRANREMIEELRVFYCEVLGLKVGFRPPFAAYGFWLYADTRPLVHLYETKQGEELPSNSRTMFDHFAFQCTERIKMEQNLNRLGIDFVSKFIPTTKNAQLFIRDPADNSVELNFSNLEDQIT